MSLPPQGPYGSQPGGGGGPQWGGQPPQGPGGQPPYGPPGGQWSQQPWGAPPPPNNGSKGKWILVGLALVAIIAVSIVGTVLVLRPDSGGGNGQQNTANSGSEFASANDTGPANIITEEPTCEAWGKISDGLDAAVPEWNDQDYSVPATNWSPEQRAVFERESAALTDAVTNVTNLAKQTPHRSMRELYGQFNAYAQAVIASIPTYSLTDNRIVATYNQFFSSLNRICDAVYFRAAQQTAPLIPVPSPPSDVESLTRGIESAPELFMESNNGVCGEWIATTDRFDKETEAWRAIDSKISADQWTSDQRAIMDAVGPVMATYADDIERLGRRSENPIWEDFAVLAAQYMRGYVKAIPTYKVNSGYMASVSTRTANAVYWACKAVA